ncbi:MAG: GNAT family N-acetyltransferase [Akkermansiaceae bacterium]|nr:GNAT family N-acetyltransferase [Akkermansiaceae bacterium]NNM28517.1 GNAT family N-acetyltransferase [Akkermansiaceae bacterium]
MPDSGPGVVPPGTALRVEAATIEDLPALTALVTELMGQQPDFTADEEVQEKGLRLILEEPSRGRIFVLRNDERIIGMVNLLFTISTAMGGFVILMEDVVVHPDHRGQGFGSMLVNHVIEFAGMKGFKRITLLADKLSSQSQTFFKNHGFEFSHLIPMRRIIGGNE